MKIKHEKAKANPEKITNNVPDPAVDKIPAIGSATVSYQLEVMSKFADFALFMGCY